MAKKPTGKPRGRPRKSEQEKKEILEQKKKLKEEKGKEKYADTPYCGIHKPRPGQKIGSMWECLERNMVGLFGLKKVDPAIIKMVEMEKDIQKGETYIIKKRSEILGIRKKLRENIKYEKDPEIKKNMENDLKKSKKVLDYLNDTYEKMRKGKTKKAVEVDNKIINEINQLNENIKEEKKIREVKHKEIQKKIMEKYKAPTKKEVEKHHKVDDIAFKTMNEEQRKEHLQEVKKETDVLSKNKYRELKNDVNDLLNQLDYTNISNLEDGIEYLEKVIKRNQDELNKTYKNKLVRQLNKNIYKLKKRIEIVEKRNKPDEPKKEIKPKKEIADKYY